MVHHQDPESSIDHINSNVSDNRIANLREATTAQNQFNTKIRADNSSGEKGVCWNKRERKWQVALYAKGKRVFWGLYQNKEDAISAVRTAREKHHGDFKRFQ